MIELDFIVWLLFFCGMFLCVVGLEYMLRKITIVWGQNDKRSKKSGF